MHHFREARETPTGCLGKNSVLLHCVFYPVLRFFWGRGEHGLAWKRREKSVQWDSVFSNKKCRCAFSRIYSLNLNIHDMHVNTFDEYVKNIARTGLGFFAQPPRRPDMTVFSFGHHESSAQCLRDFLCMTITNLKLPFAVMKSVSYRLCCPSRTIDP